MLPPLNLVKIECPNGQVQHPVPSVSFCPVVKVALLV